MEEFDPKTFKNDLREVRVALAELECVYAKVTNSEFMVSDRDLSPFYKEVRKQMRTSVEAMRDAMHLLLEKESAYLQEVQRIQQEDEEWIKEYTKKHDLKTLEIAKPEIIDLSGRKR